MIIEIALLYVLNNGNPVEQKVFKGDESSVSLLLQHCKPYEDENHICLMKDVKANKDVLYTNLETMDQVLVVNHKR